MHEEYQLSDKEESHGRWPKFKHFLTDLIPGHNSHNKQALNALKTEAPVIETEDNIQEKQGFNKKIRNSNELLQKNLQARRNPIRRKKIRFSKNSLRVHKARGLFIHIV